jgi:hypothetical protein
MGTMETGHYAVDQAKQVEHSKDTPLGTKAGTLELSESITQQNKDAGVTSTRGPADYAGAMLGDLPQDWKNSEQVKHA